MSPLPGWQRRQRPGAQRTTPPPPSGLQLQPCTPRKGQGVTGKSEASAGREGWERAPLCLLSTRQVAGSSPGINGSQYKRARGYRLSARLTLHTHTALLLGSWHCPLEEPWALRVTCPYTPWTSDGSLPSPLPGPCWPLHFSATECIPCLLTSDATSSLMTILLILPRSWAREVRVVVAVARFSTDRAQSSRSNSQVIIPSLLGPKNRHFGGSWG